MIRPFQSGDAESCCALIHACLERDPSYPSPLLQKIRDAETLESMKDRAGLFYIAVYESDDRIMGVAGLDMNEIRLLYVSPEYQDQGIGRMLLEHIKSMVPPALFSDIFVYSSRQAAGFYRACGFADKGPCAFEICGEILQTVFMALPLHPTRSM
ncbi:MAG: GNAT family N-acetyltransferase [Acidobacteria bacterium]|nr:GNAT family N-acetyltransferase [Acidobacteriota bacterium]